MCLPARSHVERGKTKTTGILIWSCGNESHGGRLWDDERVFRNRPSALCTTRAFSGTGSTATPIWKPDVHPVADIKKFLAEHPEKPFIMCEYSHAMGNSCGGITDYTEYAYEEPLYQAGLSGSTWTTALQ